MHNRNHNSAGRILATALSLAAISIGAYMIYKRDGRIRQNLRGWAYKLKGEVMDKLEVMKDVSRDEYNRIVEETARQYAGIKNIDRRELSEVIQNLKYHWHTIKNQLREGREGYDKKNQEEI